MTAPQLSVIIPAYNRERTVAGSVRSALACGAPVEVVVVDDGSSDGTAAAARAADPSAVVLSRPNGGPAAARNTGAAAARGEVLAFLDSDDHWLPGVVPRLLAALGRRPELGAVYAEALVGDPAAGYRPLSETAGRGSFADLLTDELEPGLFRLPRWPFVRKMLDRNQMFLGATLVRRSALPAGDPFDPGLFGGEDYEFCLRLAAAHDVGFFAEPLARYEKHAGGLSADGDRMAREFALATMKFREMTPGLPADVAALARRKAGATAFDYGYRLWERGDARGARPWFRRALTGPRPARAALLWGACAVGVRRAKRG